MATAATMLAHISWGPLQPLLDSTPYCPPPRRPRHTSATSRLLLLLFLASLSYFSCVFFCCCTFCVLFFFFFSSTPPLPPFHWSSLSVIEVHWTRSLRDIWGEGSRQLGFRAGFLLACCIAGPQVWLAKAAVVPAVWANTRAAVDQRGRRRCTPLCVVSNQLRLRSRWQRGVTSVGNRARSQVP